MRIGPSFQSDALIFNIDYPLGLAAYTLLVKIAEHTCPMLIYTMGRASLNGKRGGVLIPKCDLRRAFPKYLYVQ